MDAIREFLQGVQPDEISSNEEMLYVFAQFLMGKNVYEIVSSLEEDSLIRRLLMELLMEEQLYTEQQALPSAKQIVLRMGLTKLERLFREKQKHISEMDVNQDVHQYLSLLQELQAVRKDIEKQRDLITQKMSDGASQK
jgi:hypothetical protein